MGITTTTGANVPAPALNPQQEILAKAAEAAKADAAANGTATPAVNTEGAKSLDTLTIADLKNGALDKDALQGLLALLGVTAKPEAPRRAWEEFEKVYQFPSAPTSFHFSFAQNKINIPDGIYGTNDPKEIAELEAAVNCGNIWKYSPEINFAELAPTTRIPSPVRTDAVN